MPPSFRVPMLVRMSISAPHPLAPPALDLPRLAERLEAAVTLARTSPGTGALELVLTEGYGEVLRLEADRRRARTRLGDDLGRVAHDPEAVDRATRGCEDIADLTAKLERLRGLLDAARRRMRAG